MLCKQFLSVIIRQIQYDGAVLTIKTEIEESDNRTSIGLVEDVAVFFALLQSSIHKIVLDLKPKKVKIETKILCLVFPAEREIIDEAASGSKCSP